MDPPATWETEIMSRGCSDHEPFAFKGILWPPVSVTQRSLQSKALKAV